MKALTMTARIFLFTLFFFTAGLLSGAASAAEPLSLEELLLIPALRDVTGDSNGNVAWVEQTEGVWNIFVAEAPSYKARQVTHYDQKDGIEIALVGFGGGDRLVYVRGRSGFNPALYPDPPQSKLFSVSLADNTIELLVDGASAALGGLVLSPDRKRILATKSGDVWAYPLTGDMTPERLFTVRGVVSGLSFSPDGQRLAFVSDRSMYDRGRYAFVGAFDFKARRITYMTPGVGTDKFPVWSPDSQRLAFIRSGDEPRVWRFTNFKEAAPFSVMVADAATGEAAAVWTSEPGYGARFYEFEGGGFPALGGDGNLFWLADNSLVFPYEKSGWRLLYTMPASGGEPRLLTPGSFEVDGATLSPDRQTIVYWSNSEADPHRLDLYSLSLDKGLRPERISNSGMEMRYRARFITDDALVYRHAGALVPERLMVQSHDQPEIQLSTGPKPGDPITQKGVEAEIVTFKSFDGMEIPAVLYRPKDVTGKRPVIVHAHGGSRDKVYPIWYGFFGYPKVLQYYLSRGYFVMSVNYRSGTGYGLDFREPDKYGGRGADDAQDFIAAAKYLKKNVREIDPTKMIVFGHSYGGHIVTNALARSDAYALGISSAGVGDWVVEMETDFSESLQFNIPQRVELEQLAYDSSAISQIDEWGDEPILFLHGDNDGSAAMKQTIELYLALQRRGKIVDSLIMPGDGHSIRLYKNQMDYIEKIDRFLQDNLPQ